MLASLAYWPLVNESCSDGWQEALCQLGPLLVYWPAVLTLAGVISGLLVPGWFGFGGLLAGAGVGALLFLVLPVPPALGWWDAEDMARDVGFRLVEAWVVLTVSYLIGFAVHRLVARRRRRGSGG